MSEVTLIFDHLGDTQHSEVGEWKLYWDSRIVDLNGKRNFDVLLQKWTSNIANSRKAELETQLHDMYNFRKS